ncbi:ATP-dependent helicase [Lagierella sp.]|uniref:ATP-dependent helicase n=1 Tax=Lagierella sp. TaxID=2849657 RepID=UPI0026082360|nr:ATP-dependent helicase [Lagierella sp.]
MQISKQQEIAIKHNEGPALVLAVPGSGKTTVLLNRIIYLNNTCNVKDNQILNLTFSKTQAVDMKNRFKNMGCDINPIFSTIHAFCYSIIRMFAKEYKLNFRLVEGSNEFNKYSILNRLSAQNHNRYLTKEDLDMFFTNYSFTKNNMLDYSHQKNNFFTSLAKEYDEYKKIHHLIDFDDMLTFAYQILLKDEKIFKLVKRSYKYIQLDEGQDASLIQFKILEEISKPTDNLFIVADDDQSIYAFRGANPNYLLQIPNIYPQLKLMYLNINFRSSKDIVRLSDFLIQKNKNRYEKKVKSNSDQTLPITLAKVKNLKVQNKYIINYLDEIKEEETLGILFRNNINAIPIINCLNNHKIPYTKRLNFKAEILFSIVRDLSDIIQLSRENCNMEIFKRIYYKLNLYITKNYVNSMIPDTSQGIIKTILLDSTIPTYQRELLVEFSNSLNRLNKCNLEGQLTEIFLNTGYIEYLKRHFENISLDLIQEILINLAKDMEDISDIINFLKNLGKKDLLNISKPSNIFISTVHQSKGLEYDHVIITDLVDGEFPIYNEENTNMEEERRLFYVAVTRAKKHLTLLIPKARMSRKIQPSVFIDEIKNTR